MSTTTNYNLAKPPGTDSFNIATMNSNSDIIDGVLEAHDKNIAANSTQLSEIVQEQTTQNNNIGLKADKTDLDATNVAVATNTSNLASNTAKILANTTAIASKSDTTYVNSQIQTMNSVVQGFYATQSLLTTAFPSGNTNNYVVTADNYIYRWNGTAWISTGYLFDSNGIANYSIDNSKIQDNIIAPSKLSISVIEGTPNKNLFDKKNITSNYWINHINGILTTNSLYSVSAYIPVVSSVFYSISGTTEQLVWLDINKVYISGVTNASANIQAPSNACYLRLTLLNTQIDSVQVELGSVSTNYVKFGANMDIALESSMLGKSFKISPNIFDRINITTGYYVNKNNGVLVTNADYSTTDYVPVNPSTSYSISGTTEQLAWFNANKVYISGLQNVGSNIQAPSSACYLRLTIRNTELNSVQIEQGNVSTSYKKYGYLEDDTLLTNSFELDRKSVV